MLDEIGVHRIGPFFLRLPFLIYAVLEILWRSLLLFTLDNFISTLVKIERRKSECNHEIFNRDDYQCAHFIEQHVIVVLGPIFEVFLDIGHNSIEYGLHRLKGGQQE